VVLIGSGLCPVTGCDDRVFNIHVLSVKLKGEPLSAERTVWACTCVAT
jgi:hypothetical protein